MEPKYHTVYQAVIIALALVALSHPLPEEVPAQDQQHELHADNGSSLDARSPSH